MPIVAALCVAGAAALLARQSQEQTPIFRSAIEAVQFDVFVTDAAGNPVTGLTIDDFEIIEDGKPQPITTFEAVDIAIERAEPLETTLAEPDVLTNDRPLGRVYLFALDEVQDANILRTRRLVRQFIEEHFGPNDLGAVALLGRGLVTDGQDFTHNRRLLLNAVDKFSGGFSGGGNSQSCSDVGRLPAGAVDGVVDPDPIVGVGGGRMSGLSQQMASLRSMAEMMARIPGRHKAMLVFTECLDINVDDVVVYSGGVLTMRGDDAHAAMAAATRSNMAIYPIDPTGLSPGAIPLAAKAAFRAMGAATGGFALMDSNSFTESFDRIVRENSTYYMLAFNSAYEKDDGRYVRVQVNVKTPGLTVRSRAGYVAPTKILRQEQEKARAKDPTSAVSGALASPLPTNGIPMRVFATPFKARGKNSVVALAVELEAASLDLDDRDGVLHGSVDVRYLAADAKKNIRPEVARTASVEIKPDTPGPIPLEQIRLRIVSELELPPGRYQLRVAAGTDVVAGNIVYDLDVPDFSDAPLAMSGLIVVATAEPMVLTLNSASSPTSTRTVRCDTTQCAAPTTPDAPDVPLTPTLSEPLLPDGTSGSPTTRRDFSVGDQLTLVTEVYDNARRRSRDMPSVLTLTATLRDAEGKETPLVSDERPALTIREGVVGHAFKVTVTIPEVAEGPYVLRVQARSNADNERVVTRDIPVRVR
jgi:VWFA-related protein